jgi:hypothetical protein
MRNRLLAAALTAVLLAAGCKGAKPLPKTYPVTGKVLHADGSPYAGGLVQFKPEGNDDVTTTGLIQPDGSFTLTSTVDKQQVPGALEGRHTVTVLPPLAQDQRAMKGTPPLPVELRETCTVKPDGDNNFTITLPPGQ